jgi:outer membrane protein assembly factor BamB/tetratricopeptide (TPR) repeat protein
MPEESSKVSETWKYLTGGTVWGVCCSQSGEPVYCGSGDKGIYCFERDGQLAWKFDTNGPVFRVATSANGDMVIAGSKDGNIYLLDRNGLLLWNHTTTGQVLAVAMVSDGSLMLAGSTDKYLYCFDKEGTMLWRCDMKSPVRSVAISDAQDMILVSSFNNLLTCLNRWGEYQWHVESGRYPYRIAISPDGAYIATGSEDRSASLLDRSGKLLWQFPTDGSVNGVSFTPDGKAVLVGSEDMTLYLLDLTGKPIWTHDLPSEIAAVACTNRGEKVIVGTMDNRITFLESVASPAVAMGQVETEIAAAKRTGVAMNEVEYLIQSSKLLMSVGDPKKANELYQQARSELAKAVDRHAKLSMPVVNYNDKFQSSMDYLERSMSQLRRDLRESRYDMCISLAQGVSDQSKNLQNLLAESLEQYQRVHAIYSDFDKMIKDVQAEGIDVGDALKLLTAALSSVKLGDYTNAVEMLKRTELAIVSKRTQFREAVEIMGPIRSVMKNAERYVDISDAKKLLEEAEKALNANDTERARECAELIMDVIEKVKAEATPSLSLRAGSSEGLTVNKSKFNISITNIGKGHAQDIACEIIGPIKDYSTTPPRIDFLKAGDKATMAIEVAADEHDIPLDAYLTVRLTFKRAIDQKESRTQERARVIIGPMIEDVFLMYRDGRLIAHNTRRLRPDVDGDILSGMLTAVTAFVKESFREADTEELNELRYGKTKILIERGEYICLAVVVSGVASPKMREKMKESVNYISQTYMAVLENWDGSVSKLKDINQIVEKLIASTYT